MKIELINQSQRSIKNYINMFDLVILRLTRGSRMRIQYNNKIILDIMLNKPL